MENINHPVDKYFLKGLNNYEANPSAALKKKIFATPSAIKPVKPWYGSGKFVTSFSVIVATLSIVVFSFLYFQGESSGKDSLADKTQEKTTEFTTPAFTRADMNGAGTTSGNDDSDISAEQNIISDSYNTLPSKYEASQNLSYQNQKPEKINQTSPQPLINPLKSDVKKTSTNENAEFLLTGNNTGLQSNVMEPRTKENLIMTRLHPLMPELKISGETFEYNVYKEPEYVLKGLKFIELISGCNFAKHRAYTSESELDNAVNAKQNLLRISCGHEVQLNAVFQRKNFIVKTGLSFNSIGETLKGNYLLANPCNNTDIVFNNFAPYDTLIGGNYFNIDTTGGYYHYFYTQTSQIFISDSVWEWNTAYNQADVFDTLTYVKTDTLPRNTQFNNIRFFEFPVSAGFIVPYRRFSFSLQMSAIPGIFISAKGYNISPSFYPALTPYEIQTFRKITFSAGILAETGYSLTESLSFVLSAYYRHSFTPLYNKNNSINQKAEIYGMRIGLRKLL